MPKIPDDMSAAAEMKRAEMAAATLAKGAAKAAEPPPAPKPRIAKKR